MSEKDSSTKSLAENSLEDSAISMVSSPASANRSWSSRFNRLFPVAIRQPVILLSLIAAVISRGISQGEFFFYYDEMFHAMNGVFFRDLISDFPVRHPLEYAFQYYAKYPSVKILYWPALFHLVEGLFFLVFGLAPWVSRLAVLSFALMGAYFWYRIAERLGPQSRAFMSTVTIACVPFILLYERVTMLEIPSLATCTATIYFWLKFQDTGRRRDLWAVAGFAAASFLVSQKAIFLVLFFALYCLVERPYRVLKRIDVWLTLFVSSLVVLPWYLLASKTFILFWARAVGERSSFLINPATYFFYLRQLYLQLGPILLGLACVGLVISLVKRTTSHRLLLTWIFAGYFCFTFISEKDPRHSMICIPPLIYLAFVAIDTVLVRRTWAFAVSLALTLTFLVIGFRTQRPIVGGPRDAARYVFSQPDSDIVYYQGRLNGDFVFFARKFDPQKMHVVVRDKQIVGRRNELQPVAAGDPTTEQQILSFFQTWGVRYAVVEEPDLFLSFKPAHEVFYSPQFELIRTFPAFTNWPDTSVRQIQVFRYRGELRRTEQSITFPVELIRKDLHLTLSQIAGRPWPH
jgi:Dolichyl-phosphate-mannose-protein mannosyltransferase